MLFLSRLCGGEYDKMGAWVAEDFLSRLCGGECTPVLNITF